LKIIIKDLEDAQASGAGCPHASPESHVGGRAPGTFHYVIARGIEKRRIKRCGIPLAEAGRQLGVSTSAVSKTIRRRKSNSI